MGCGFSVPGLVVSEGRFRIPVWGCGLVVSGIFRLGARFGRLWFWAEGLGIKVSRFRLGAIWVVVQIRVPCLGSL